MAATGEQSGKIDEMLGRAAKVYEDELDERLAAISTLIEPILMVVLALVAGGIVAAKIRPAIAKTSTTSIIVNPLLVPRSAKTFPRPALLAAGWWYRGGNSFPDLFVSE